MRVLCIAPNFQLNIGTKCQFSIHPLLKKLANNRALCEMILWCKKISISRSWEYVKNGPPAKGALWLLKGSFQSLHWHHNIWIQFRNRCISNMQILSGKGLVIVLAPFIVARYFKMNTMPRLWKDYQICAVYFFFMGNEKKTRAMKGFIFK